MTFSEFLLKQTARKRVVE